MTYQNPNSEDTFLIILAILAGVVFVVVLVIGWALLRSKEDAKKNGIQKKQNKTNDPNGEQKFSSHKVSCIDRRALSHS